MNNFNGKTMSCYYIDKIGGKMKCSLGGKFKFNENFKFGVKY